VPLNYNLPERYWSIIMSNDLKRLQIVYVQDRTNIFPIIGAFAKIESLLATFKGKNNNKKFLDEFENHPF
jgi:hypothetical protein